MATSSTGGSAQALRVRFDLLYTSPQLPRDLHPRSINAALAELKSSEGFEWCCIGCNRLAANEVAQTRVQITLRHRTMKIEDNNVDMELQSLCKSLLDWKSPSSIHNCVADRNYLGILPQSIPLLGDIDKAFGVIFTLTQLKQGFESQQAPQQASWGEQGSNLYNHYMLLMNRCVYHTDIFAWISKDTIDEFAQPHSERLAKMLKLAHHYACVWASDAGHRIEHEYKQKLEHLDQKGLVELLSEASAPFFDASRKLEEAVKLLAVDNLGMLDNITARNPTASESRMIFRCLQELLSSIQPFLAAILAFSDALFERALLYGIGSGVSGAVALAAHFCPIPGGWQALELLKIGLKWGGGLTAAGSGIASVRKCREYGRTMTMKQLCTSIATVHASTRIFLLLASVDSAQGLEFGSKQREDLEELLKKRFNIETLSAENGAVGAFLQKEVGGMSKGLRKLEEEMREFKKSYTDNKGRNSSPR
ncbi:hypothetical protein P170DRAFT_471005 [Aspergillus steynii IBT 23096]|uniref:Uncharacterized protein n=1 Tax=Aspergillus steynii IBT 23096 TaxID=1392250 RepID=A0A2I2GRU7_9EURO|nr:uncharacterized protein P170DRAFT_471005 [Aspergillus steynii IBT 23096]PLB55594.1 hypothetical protein P170DRAFT_471005 [Aspergillus steynii IBT 23096]